MYHQLGNCYADAGDVAKAVDYYLRAIECFAPLEFGQFLSNSISELGLVVLKIGFDASLEKILQEDLIMMGLKDVESEIASLIVTDKYGGSKSQDSFWLKIR